MMILGISQTIIRSSTKEVVQMDTEAPLGSLTGFK